MDSLSIVTDISFHIRDDNTIASSASPPRRPAPPPWEDRYAPAELRAANNRDRARQAAVPTTSTLGRRSRKELNLDNESNADPEDSARQRPRSSKWGAEEAIDGDDEARFIGVRFDTPVVTNVILIGNVILQRGRTRKRDQEAEEGEEDQEHGRAKSKRRVTEPERLQTMPGALPDMQPAASGKRKAADEEEEEVPKDQTTVQPPRKARKKTKHPDGQTLKDGKREEKKTEGNGRQPGDEWEADGVRNKMGTDMEELREAFVKEQAPAVKAVGSFISELRAISTDTLLSRHLAVACRRVRLLSTPSKSVG